MLFVTACLWYEANLSYASIERTNARDGRHCCCRRRRRHPLVFEVVPLK